MISLTPKDLKWLEETLARLEDEVKIVYFTEKANCRHCRRERDILTELADLSHKLHLEIYNFTADHDIVEQYGIDKVPGIVLEGEKDYGIRYYGMLSDFEFSMFLQDIERISSGQSGLSAGTIDALGQLSGPVHLEVLTTPTCPFTMGAIRLAHQLAMASDNVTADLVNVNDFPELLEHHCVRAAPTVVVNGDYCFYGAVHESEFVAEVIKGFHAKTK